MTISLYEYQEEDVVKLARQKAALIGSEMGTGKTHQAIAIDQIWYKQLEEAGYPNMPTLVVAPINTFSSWVEKYAEQAPDIDVYVIDRKNRHAFIQAIRQRKADVYLMHWDALRLLVDEFNHYGIVFGTVVADEVHRAANKKSQSTNSLKKIRCHRKLGMSGTASGDKPWNLWSILNWLWPSFYRSYWKFINHYVTKERVETDEGAVYIKMSGVKNEQSLHKEMAPWYVRHLKREQCCAHHPNGVMHWLPEKTYDRIWVDLSPTQRRFYNQMRKDMVAWVGEHEDTPLVAQIVVAQLARLSQMTLATPEIVGTKWVWKADPENPGQKIQVEVPDVKLFAPSSKIDAVKELIQDHEGKRFVLFSASKQACYIAAEELARANITSEVLSGDTKDADRRTMVARFVNGDFQVFIAVIQAAAEGIDGLQHATDTAIFLDRSWSTIKNKQAEDRLHRGGQKDTVTIIDIMARNTLDFGRHTKLNEKWEWIKTILGDNLAQQKVLKGQL